MEATVVIGLDYHNTITKHERLFKRLAAVWIANGIPVFIISALKNPTDPKIKKEVDRCKVPHTGVELVYFKDYEEIAELKLAACKRLSVSIMFDDMPSVCKLLAKNGIATGQIR
jgi:hypothetical protein